MFHKKVNKNDQDEDLSPETPEQSEPELKEPDQAAINLAGWQKALADYQNLQRDSEKRITQLKSYVQSDLVAELLPIFDNYEIALSHIPEVNKKDSWAVGLEHTLKLWQTFLADHGIQKIATVGTAFDTNIHESIGMVEDESIADQQIVEEKQAGYKLGDLVIRHAKVIINNLNK